MVSQSAVPVVAAVVVVDVVVDAVVAAAVVVVDVATLSHFSGSGCRHEKYCKFFCDMFF